MVTGTDNEQPRRARLTAPTHGLTVAPLRTPIAHGHTSRLRHA